jgi:uncharacterized protein YwgA
MIPVQPRDLPLLLASSRFASDEETEPLDRIRMQKGVFLAQMGGPNEWRELFDYEPYDWGPYSRALASALSGLRREELLEVEPVPQSRYATYRATARGERLVDELADALDESQVDFIRRVRQFVTTRSFNRLLRDVYAAYPGMATASRFVG